MRTSLTLTVCTLALVAVGSCIPHSSTATSASGNPAVVQNLQRRFSGMATAQSIAMTQGNLGTSTRPELSSETAADEQPSVGDTDKASDAPHKHWYSKFIPSWLSGKTDK
ncbi:hypothetical protein IWQ60_006224 [Tieghemiomyces parasiticus]|uniref:RxLR effector protein n=1 Tax=Tieghemiomyces parasiticus TaxID=78921 RepID=A0A9W8A4S9_9FUNG|nr:hypothetical protein IWQ60_006224 [Tieghemiomyces parasiticus]